MNINEYDELIFVKDEKFSAGVCGSPMGEVKQFIHTPFITMVNLDVYDKGIDGKYVYVDKRFCLDEYLYVQNRYDRVIRRLPLGLH